MALRGATFDENESPPPEGCRGGLFRREDPPLKAKACSFLKAALPSQEGIFKGERHVAQREGSQNHL
jgi:hypothetical protein